MVAIIRTNVDYSSLRLVNLKPVYIQYLVLFIKYFKCM